MAREPLHALVETNSFDCTTLTVNGGERRKKVCETREAKRRISKKERKRNMDRERGIEKEKQREGEKMKERERKSDTYTILHGLSVSLSRASTLESSAAVAALGRSILLAKNKMGTSLEEISVCVEREREREREGGREGGRERERMRGGMRWGGDAE